MASLTIEIIVSADPTENVHSQVKANSADVWEVGPMLDRAIRDLHAERDALPPSHWPTIAAEDGSQEASDTREGTKGEAQTRPNPSLKQRPIPMTSEEVIATPAAIQED